MLTLLCRGVLFKTYFIRPVLYIHPIAEHMPLLRKNRLGSELLGNITGTVKLF